MFSAIDTDGNEQIDKQEFLDMMAATVKEDCSEEDLILAFKVFDIESNGCVTVPQLRCILSDISDVTDQEIEELITEVDEGGQVNYREFVRTMNAQWRNQPLVHPKEMSQ